jgi:hypothetical protein
VKLHVEDLNTLQLTPPQWLKVYSVADCCFLAATLLAIGNAKAQVMLIGAWGYAFGGMFVPFFAHLEAFMRGVEVRTDHPIDDVGSIIL